MAIPQPVITSFTVVDNTHLKVAWAPYDETGLYKAAIHIDAYINYEKHNKEIVYTSGAPSFSQLPDNEFTFPINDKVKGTVTCVLTVEAYDVPDDYPTGDHHFLATSEPATVEVPKNHGPWS